MISPTNHVGLFFSLANKPVTVTKSSIIAFMNIKLLKFESILELSDYKSAVMRLELNHVFIRYTTKELAPTSRECVN